MVVVAGPGFDEAEADPVSEDEVWLRPLAGCSRSYTQRGSQADISLEEEFG